MGNVIDSRKDTGVIHEWDHYETYEIEKKAESILTEAAAEKEKMLKQLEFDKREMDGRYISMRQKQEEEIKQQLLSEAETKITRQREHYEAAKSG